MRRVLLAAVTVLATALTLTACGSEDDASSTESTSTEEFNDADVSFAQDMIQHHRQAIEMASLAGDRAQSADVKSLASDIEAAQQPEIDTLSGWLEAWGEEVPEEMSGDMSGMEMSEDMPGMMTADDMAALEGASGPEFDEMFLTMMIEHHQGAIEMAQMEQEDGANPDALALAEKIETDQQGEVETMQDLLGS
jgi:uncharacterized protein (DUF305 family)